MLNVVSKCNGRETKEAELKAFCGVYSAVMFDFFALCLNCFESAKKYFEVRFA